MIILLYQAFLPFGFLQRNQQHRLQERRVQQLLPSSDPYRKRKLR